MGNENFGDQLQTFEYRSEARSKLFNKVLTDILPEGILSGGDITVLNERLINISPLVCLIRANNLTAPDELVVRVETKNNVQKDLTIPETTLPNEAAPYVVLRYAWEESETNFMDVLMVGFSDDPDEEDEGKVMPRDLILGKILFEDDGKGGRRIIPTTVDAVDLTRRFYSYNPILNRFNHELKVVSSEVSPNKVKITNGALRTPTGIHMITGGEFPPAGIQPTTANGRIDLIYIDSNGDLQYQEGTPAPTPKVPTYFGEFVIAEVHRGPGRTDVKGTDIVQIHKFRKGSYDASGLTIQDTGNYFPGQQSINQAIQSLASAVYDVILGSESPSFDHIKDYHIDWGTGDNQVSAVDIPFSNGAQRYTKTDVESALEEVMESLQAHENRNLTAVSAHGIIVVPSIV